MFKVKAIENKDEQKRMCELCCAEYKEDSFAYAAYDVKTADDESGEAIAVCQFTFIGGCAIHCLTPAEGREDDEAVLILGFAVLEFLRRCGFKEVTANMQDSYAVRLGFRNTDGKHILDLTAGRACGGH
ncbi:MAG: hypothetical protein IJ386_09725 [Clostridia bacterium]|nr:hypothetical protein [Clostridia bacterium]